VGLPEHVNASKFIVTVSITQQQVGVQDVFRRPSIQFSLGVSLGGYTPHIGLGKLGGCIRLGVLLRNSLYTFSRRARTPFF